MVLWKTATFTLTNSANCTVLSTPLNTYRVSNNTICRLLVCSEWPPIANSIFTTVIPISCWMVDCTACTCWTIQLSDSPAACFCPFNAFESVGAPSHSACTRSTRFYSWRPSPMRYFHAKRFSLAFSMWITPCGIEAIAAVRSYPVLDSCVLQKLVG